MENIEFHKILQNAVQGDNESIEILLKLYRPLIDGNSYLNGTFDEDLRQYIMLHIVQNITKFKI